MRVRIDSAANGSDSLGDAAPARVCELMVPSRRKLRWRQARGVCCMSWLPVVGKLTIEMLGVAVRYGTRSDYPGSRPSL